LNSAKISLKIPPITRVYPRRKQKYNFEQRKTKNLSNA
jgi:hypothetical protein